jgi:hypothetical protein
VANVRCNSASEPFTQASETAGVITFARHKRAVFVQNLSTANALSVTINGETFTIPVGAGDTLPCDPVLAITFAGTARSYYGYGVNE